MRLLRVVGCLRHPNWEHTGSFFWGKNWGSAMDGTAILFCACYVWCLFTWQKRSECEEYWELRERGKRLIVVKWNDVIWLFGVCDPPSNIREMRGNKLVDLVSLRERENLVHTYWSEKVGKFFCGVVSSVLSFQRFWCVNLVLVLCIILFNYK